MKVTKKMIEDAEKKHFRTESYSSLQKQHALEAVYYKQQGNKKYAKMYADLAPKSMIERIEKGTLKKRKLRRRTSSPFGIKMPVVKYPRF